VESAMRTLAKADAVRSEPESMSRVFVRLLATPERIKQELTGTENVEREVLRALYRAVGKAIYDGAAIDLDGLPPGFGGASGVMPVLEALQRRQFVLFERTGGGTRLTNAKVPLARFKVDWAGMDRRRNGELSKLEAVQRYAYASGCRRAFVLRYFGDPAARVTCSGCDNCLGIKHDAPDVSATRLGNPKPTRTRDRRATGAAAATGEVAKSEYVVGEEAAPLFAALKALRGAIAREEQVPAYVVFADRTLAELAVRRPRSEASMGDVRGVGPAKLEKYGARFLAVIRNANETEAA